MRKILCLILALVLMTIMAIPSYASEASEIENDGLTGNVYAKYVNAVERNETPVQSGSTTVTTNDGYTVSVSGAPAKAAVLRVVPIPAGESAAWNWIKGCIDDNITILSILDIYFVDANGNRINASGVTVTIAGVAGDVTVFSVSTEGNARELSSTPSNGAMLFTADRILSFAADGSHYYVLAKKAEPGPAPGNHVTIEKSEGGDVSISDQNPETGNTVTITPVPDEGKEVDAVVVKDKDGNEIPVTNNGDGTYSYVQPDGDVTIQVTFKDEEPAPAEEYNVTIQDTLGGDVAVSDMTPTAGQTVTITPKPDNGKVVNKVIVTDENGKTVKVTDNGDGTYSYTQPAGDVTIKVTFKNKPSSDKPGDPATGDNSNIVLWTGVLILSALMLLWIIWGKRRKSKNEG